MGSGAARMSDRGRIERLSFSSVDLGHGNISLLILDSGQFLGDLSS